MPRMNSVTTAFVLRLEVLDRARLVGEDAREIDPGRNGGAARNWSPRPAHPDGNVPSLDRTASTPNLWASETIWAESPSVVIPSTGRLVWRTTFSAQTRAIGPLPIPQSAKIADRPTPHRPLGQICLEFEEEVRHPDGLEPTSGIVLRFTCEEGIIRRRMLFSLHGLTPTRVTGLARAGAGPRIPPWLEISYPKPINKSTSRVDLVKHGSRVGSVTPAAGKAPSLAGQEFIGECPEESSPGPGNPGRGRPPVPEWTGSRVRSSLRRGRGRASAGPPFSGDCSRGCRNFSDAPSGVRTAGRRSGWRGRTSRPCGPDFAGQAARTSSPRVGRQGLGLASPESRLDLQGRPRPGSPGPGGDPLVSEPAGRPDSAGSGRSSGSADTGRRGRRGARAGRRASRRSGRG